MKKLNYIILTFLLLLLLSSCADKSTNPVKCKNDLPSILNELYDCEPRMNDCYEGILKQSVKDLVLTRLNNYRNLHGLPTVTYNNADDISVQKSALITCANEVMNHFPDSTATCYSAEGKSGCSTGNLWIGRANSVMEWKSDNMINDWIIDYNVVSLGHRRWLLNPFLKTIAFGRADKIKSDGWHWTASTIKVIPASENFGTVSTDRTYVAYPEGDYPESYFKLDWYLSFSVLTDKNSFNNNNQVSFSAATIEVRNDNQSIMRVDSVKHDNSGYGLPNNIQWIVNGLQPDVRYTVKISNVSVKGVKKDYQYTFRVTSTS